MEFTYRAYKGMLSLLRENGYAFSNYHSWEETSRCAILRHDVDNSLEQAARLAEVEAEEGVSSTYFVMLCTDFYNAASRRGQAALRSILSLGHEIGLHFDEAAYGRELTAEETVQSIIKERGFLSGLLGAPVSAVSMHRPSRATLEADLRIPGIVNSYGKTFFHDFKYLSDSRRSWREPVLDIVRSGEYGRLHILTHAFWYHQEDESMETTISDHIRAAGGERYAAFLDNIKDLTELKLEVHVGE